MIRGDFPRPRKMVNYSHMLVAALALTSFILLVKYRNLTARMSEENVINIMSQKALRNDLETELHLKRQSEQQLSKLNNDLRETSSQLQNSRVELSNTATALQSSYQQIERLKQENISKTEEINRMREGNDELQQQIINLQQSLAEAEDTIAKTKALADDNAITLKGFQEKHELLLNHNQEMGMKLGTIVQTLKEENGNLKNQLKEAIEDANLAKAKVTELENIKLQTQENQTKSLQEGDKGNTINLDNQTDAAAKLEEIPQGQGTNIQQETTGVVNANDSMSNPKSIDNTNTQNTGSSKAANDNVQIQNISEELKHYDMLEDDVKEQIKKEMQANDRREVIDQELEDQDQVLTSSKENKNDQPAGEEAEDTAVDKAQNVEENKEQMEVEKNKEEDDVENNDMEVDDIETGDENSAIGKRGLKVSQNPGGSFQTSPGGLTYSTETSSSHA